ncbi:uncharacterized protein LOC144983757 [Oryzias latipes]
MEIVSLLLVAGMAQLFSLTACSPTIQPNLKDIINEIPKLNESIHKEYFVEDVQDLADNCMDDFFCKVLHILKNHQHFSKADQQQEHKIVKNLLQFTKNMKCEEKPKKESGVKTAITVLLENLKKCSQHRNTFQTTTTVAN